MKTAAVTASAVAAVGLAYWYWSRADDDAVGGDDDADGDTLPREMILDIFNDLQKEMPAKMAPLMQQLEMIKSQNPSVNEAELMKFVATNFDKVLLGVQEKVFAEYNVDEADVDAATHFYMSEQDAEVLEAVNDFRTMYTQFGGEIDIEVPVDLTEAKMCAAFDDYAAARDKANDLIMVELQRSQGKMTEAQHRVLMTHAQSLMAAALKKHGISQAVWPSAVKAFMASSAAFKSKFEEDAEEQNQKMMRMQQGMK